MAWHGLTLRHDHPFWRSHFPPNGWGCGCRVTPVTKAEGERSAKAGLDEPPAGWDKPDPKTGAPVGIDKGFDYAMGQNRTELDRMLLAPKLAQLFGKTPPSAIAHGAKPDSIEQVLSDFLSTFGEKVPAFKSLTHLSGDHKMATAMDGRYFFGTTDPTHEKNLREAMLAIRQGRELTASQESMIKTLWHEIGHNRQTQMVGRKYVPDSVNELLAEATNEFIALRTYPQFLRAIGGGQAKHMAAARLNSGYGFAVARLEALMRAVGINPDSMLAKVEKLSFEGPINDKFGNSIEENLSKSIVQTAKAQGVKTSLSKVKYAMSVIKDAAAFKKALQALP